MAVNTIELAHDIAERQFEIMATRRPKVSIIIPVFNDESHVADAIESALAQTYSDVEVVVVDDGSTDATPGILKRYEGKIVLVTQENQGAGGSRNTGIRASSGEYLSFLDSDDLFMPAKSEIQAELLDKHPEVGLVYGVCRAIDERDGSVIKMTRVERAQSDRSNGPFPPTYPTPSFMARREWLEKVGGFNGEMRWAMDTDLRFKLWAAGCVFMPLRDVVTSYRIRMGGLSSNPVEQARMHLRALKRHCEAMGESMSAKARDKHLGFIWLRIACGHIAQKSTPDAAAALRKALSYDPSLLTSYSSWDLIVYHANPGFPGLDRSWNPGLSGIWDSVISILKHDESEPRIKLFDKGRSSEKAALAHALYRRAFADGKGLLARKLFLQFLIVSKGRLPREEPSRHAVQVAIGPLLTRLIVKLQRLIRRPRRRQGRQDSQAANEHELARMN